MSTSGHDDTVAGTTPPGPGSASVSTLVAHRYKIVRMLGGGGMGRVYEALDTELGERVALKVLRDGMSEHALERFRREVRLTRRIQHANVARMFDIGEDVRDGAPSRKFLTMELVDGEPLTHEIGQPMAWPRLRKLALDLCAGLAAAHERGVIHRDLKPDNVMIERASDRAVITDFGIARSDDATDGMTQVGAVIGTPRYMSPEQLAGGELDVRADIFSLGVMFYELATGRRPWSGDSAVAIAVAQATHPARPCSSSTVPASFAAVVDACLAIDRDKRPASASALHQAIAGIADDEPAKRAPERPSVGSLTWSPTPAPTTGTVIEAPSQETAIAVLPFHSVPEDQYLADGLREDLLDTLSTVVGLRVRAAGSVVVTNDVRAVGEELGVDTLVTGSLRRTPAGLRVSARLVSVADGFQIWAQRVDCESSQLLQISDELGRAITTALSTRASGIQAARPTDPRAVDLYLRARAELRRFWGEHAESATQLLEQAVALSPGSPQIASSYAVAAVMAWFKQVKPELLPRARAAVERALATGHGEAYLASALMQQNLGDLEGAARDLAKALVRAPMAPLVHETIGRLLVEVSDTSRGRHHLETAMALDVMRTPLVTMDLARLDALHGRLDDANAKLALLMTDPDPAIQHVGAMLETRIAMWLRDYDRIFRALSVLTGRIDPRATDSLRLVMDFVEGKPFDEALWTRVTSRIQPTDATPKRLLLVGLQRLVETALLCRQRERAIEALELCAHWGVLDIVWVDRCVLLQESATEPRWQAARARIAEHARRVEQALVV
ncbi:MAG TPA: protein kinase [Kofleriaceae bacterium]|nr:protein kinase [Kofleriaceae bacterium]